MTSSYFEIVRTSHPEKPWLARFIANGSVVFMTPNYSRKVGAERAVMSMARVFLPEADWEADVAQLVEYVDARRR